MKESPVVFKRFADISRCVYLLESSDGSDVSEKVKKHLPEFTEMKKNGSIMTLSLHRYGSITVLYYECVGCDILPQELVPEDGIIFRPMMDVYHGNLPEGLESWSREKEFRPQCRVIFLRPEKVSGYIFYHFQLQEEYPGGMSQRFLISILENLLFMYTEEPDKGVKPGYAGILHTENSPTNWPELMTEHFKPWDDGAGDEWRDTETLLFV